ncbi:MAG: transglycosylase SLT domain-containing protein [Pseudomonadota bacterium]
MSAALMASASGSALAQPWSPEMHNTRIAFHATVNGIPQSLVRRVIYIESKGNPRLISKGNYGLMQIRLGTAKAMGYTGDAEGLLDPDVNMTYAVKYLAGAYRAANGSEDGAIRNYQRGYYVSAKAKGFSPYEKPPVVSAAAMPKSAEKPMPPAPRSTIAAMITPAQTPNEIVRSRMTGVHAAPAEMLETKPALDTRPAMPATTTAMAPSDQRPVVPKLVKIEKQVAARPAAVKSDAPPVEAVKTEIAKTEIAKTDLNIPLPRPAPQRAAPVLASVEPTAPAPEVQKAETPQVETPKSEATVPLPPVRATRHERQKARVAAVPPAAAKPALVAAVPAESAEKPAAQSGENKSLWSAFTNELSAVRGTNATPARQQTAAAPAAEPAAAPSRKSRKSAKEAEPFNLLTYVKKKIAPDTKPEKKKTPQT